VDEAFYRENISGRANAEIVGDLLPDLSEREGRKIVEAKSADALGSWSRSRASWTS
jgi:hypothetical protein